MSSATDRTKWKFDSEYMCAPQIQNSIPSVACGEPFAKKIEVDTNYNNFAVYRESNLEKNYTWQPHFGMNVGLTFDFVDQDALINKPTASNQINEADKKFIQSTSLKNKSKVISDDTWWLRNPVYLENNLYSLTNNFKASMADETRAMRDQMNRERMSGDANGAAGDSESIFAREYADKSFDEVKELEQQIRSGDVAVEYCIPLLPHAEAHTRSYSAVKYEIDPLAANMEEEKLSYSQQDPRELARKRMRMRHSVGMNSRSLDDTRSKVSGIAPAKNNVFAISIVAPAIVAGNTNVDGTSPAVEAEPEEEDEEDEDDLFGDDSDDDEANVAAKKTKKEEKSSASKKRVRGEMDDTASGSGLGVVQTAPFTWVKDFKTEVRNKNLPDTFALFIDTANADDGVASYIPLRSQMIMSKLPYLDKSSLPVPQEVLVSRIAAKTPSTQ